MGGRGGEQRETSMGNNPIILSRRQVVQHFVDVPLRVHDFELIVTRWPDSSLSHIVSTPYSHFHVQAVVRLLHFFLATKGSTRQLCGPTHTSTPSQTTRSTMAPSTLCHSEL